MLLLQLRAFARHSASWLAGPVTIRHFDFSLVKFSYNQIYWPHCSHSMRQGLWTVCGPSVCPSVCPGCTHRCITVRRVCCSRIWCSLALKCDQVATILMIFLRIKLPNFVQFKQYYRANRDHERDNARNQGPDLQNILRFIIRLS